MTHALKPFRAKPFWAKPTHLILIGMLLCALVFVMMPPVVYGNHATDRHGTAALQVRDCLEKNGPAAIFERSSTGRQYFCTPLDNGKWGVMVVEKAGDKFQEISAFVKEKLNTFEQLVRYLGNGGATQIWP